MHQQKYFTLRWTVEKAKAKSNRELPGLGLLTKSSFSGLACSETLPNAYRNAGSTGAWEEALAAPWAHHNYPTRARRASPGL